MKNYLIVFWAFLCVCGAKAQNDSLKYRIYLKDKALTTYSIQEPEKYLSLKSIERRKRQGLKIDSTDLPVCTAYVDAIRKKGVKIVLTGKWNNFVTVSCSDTACLADIRNLPFVKGMKKVWTYSTNEAMNFVRDSLVEKPHYYKDTIYGAAITQLQISNVDKLHEAGFRGQGMTIAVIDAGFHNVDRMKSMKNIKILGMKDFVCAQADMYAESSHGTEVLSCMAMNTPHVMIGSAPEASYWLLRSENEYTEHLVEQDYWSAAVEFADSVGVDVVNTSLGYYEFDDATQNYQLHELDGKHALMSLQASLMASKGMLLVCSAGNSGMGSWKKITPPGDAENILTVGAIAKNGVLAPFSSVGNTTDGRIKPDVVAVGINSDVMNPTGMQGIVNGTSFSSPIMCGMAACLWQACPDLNVLQLITLIRNSGNRAAHPDNIYGFGIPDFWKAYQSRK